MRKYSFLVFIIFTVFLASAQNIPQRIYYQGNLANAVGEAINDCYPMTFSLWTDSTGGDKLWEEIHEDVPIKKGLFYVILGSINHLPFNVFSDSSCYLEIVIVEETLAPRQRVVSVPYAYSSASVCGESNVFPSQGDVGIGTIDPSEKLEVHGTIYSKTGGYKFPDGTVQSTAATGGTGGDHLGNHTAIQNINLNGHWLSGDGSNNGVYIQNDGDVCIGTSTNLFPVKLFVDGDLRISGLTTCENFLGAIGYLAYNQTGVWGSGSSRGMYGKNTNGNFGELGTDDYGVYGKHNSTGNYGYLGSNLHGVYGKHSSGNIGSLGRNREGVYGYAASSIKYAGWFDGKININGTLMKSGGSFKIDHPLDPENKYLCHSFIESPDMKNVYDGVVILDENGEASVELPEWFEALNKDFRYQLTCIGGFCKVYIAEKINHNRFKIAGGKPDMEISWQVTGIRQDPWANENRIVVEEMKEGDERGRYLHPKEYGVSEALGIGYEERKRMEEEHNNIEEEQRKIDEELFSHKH